MTEQCQHMIVKPRRGTGSSSNGPVISEGSINMCMLVNKECLRNETGLCQVAGMEKITTKGDMEDMNVIFRPQQGGKTTELIKRAEEIGGLIVTNTIPDAEKVARLARDMGVSIKKPISIRQFNINVGEILRDKIPVLVDDAEYVLEYLMNMSLAGSKIELDTITVTDEKTITGKADDKTADDKTTADAPANKTNKSTGNAKK